MNGDIAVRSMSASISLRAERTAPFTSSTVTGSISDMAGVSSPERDDQIAGAVDPGALAGEDDRRRVELIDDRRPIDAMPGVERVASVDRRRDPSFFAEVHAA